MKVSSEDRTERPYCSILLGKGILDLKTLAYKALLLALSVSLHSFGFIEKSIQFWIWLKIIFQTKYSLIAMPYRGIICLKLRTWFDSSFFVTGHIKPPILPQRRMEILILGADVK